MQKLKNLDSDITLHVVGQGKDRTKLEEFCQKNNLSVIFYGYLHDDELNKLYESTTIQIIPSIFEGFGISVLEGMAHRIPIIATNTDGIRSIIKDYQNGMLVMYNDVESLVYKIQELINNINLQKKLVINSSKELGMYDWKNIYLKTVDVYEKAFQSK